MQNLNETSISLIEQLARHFASELDLHYNEIDDLTHGEEIKLLITAAIFLADHGIPMPKSVQHVLARAAGKPFRVQ